MIGRFVTAVDEVVDGDVSEMSDAAVEREFVELCAQMDRLEHRKSVLLAAVHRRGIALVGGMSSTPTWAQHVAGVRADEARVALEVGLACEGLPLTSKAWRQGEISASAARTIRRGKPEGHDENYAAVEEMLVDFAAGNDWRGLRAAIAFCRRVADALDDREPSDRNGLQCSRVGDRWVLNADLDDLAGATVDAALSAATDAPLPADDRKPAKRRADALVRVARFFLDHADTPVEGGEAPHVTVVLDWETITEHQPSSAVAGPSLSPGQVSELLCGAQISRVVTGPKGELLDLGRAQRNPSRAMRRGLVARDGGCRFPGCHRRASWSHAHHVIAWTDGGPTSVENLVLLCSFHHHLVHRPGWRATFDGHTFTVFNPRGDPVGNT
jgi:hypothetical protein